MQTRTVPLRCEGAQRWEHEREFADLVTDAAQEWRWVPRFEHLLIDQTELGAESVTGAVAARVLQIVMMATFREAPGELLEWVTRLIGELYREFSSQSSQFAVLTCLRQVCEGSRGRTDAKDG